MNDNRSACDRGGEAMHWYAVYTRPRWEKKVAAALTAAGVEAYCPLNRTVRQWSDRKKTVEVPLFTSYVFVHITPEEQLAVRMTAGVVNFVYWLGAIASIRQEEMQQLQEFVAQYGNICLERLNYQQGDIFSITAGPFKGHEALVKSVGRSRIELVLKNMNVKLLVNCHEPEKKSPSVKRSAK